MKKSYVYQLIDSAGTATEMSTIVDKQPAHESQVRPLTALDNPEQRADAWTKAVDKAGGDQPTARQVQEVVDEIIAPEPKVCADVLRDELGNAVEHPNAIQAFLHHGRLKVALLEARKLARELAELAALPVGAYLDGPDVHEHLQAVTDSIRHALPYAICPAKVEATDPGRKLTGFLTKAQWIRLPDDLKE